MARAAIPLCIALMVCGCGGGGGGAGGSGGGSGETCQAFDDGVTAAPEAWTDIPKDGGVALPNMDRTSCAPLGAATGICPFRGQVIDFEDDAFKSPSLQQTKVVVFPANQIPDITILDDVETKCEAKATASATATCQWGIADDSGFIEFPNITCNQPFAVWAHKPLAAAPVTKPAVEFDRVARDPNPSTNQDVLTISQTTYRTVQGIVGFSTDPTLGTVAGKVTDCADHTIKNLGINITDSHVATAPDSFCGTALINKLGTFYFRDNFPVKEQTATSEDGLYGFSNVPPGDVTVFVFSNVGGNKVEVGRVQLVSLPDTITIADVILDTTGTGGSGGSGGTSGSGGSGGVGGSGGTGGGGGVGGGGGSGG